jgi:LIVCS family branched-chain amino acid:cation transporter
MQISSSAKITISTGLALFAMFFGAGNIIFPLQLGSSSGQYFYPALIAFIISGVGVPFLGLFAASLYEGNYWKFFQRLGKIPAFIVITFLILIIGPLFAAPRTEVVTYHTLLPVLPHGFSNQYVFDAFYFLLIFALVAKQSRVVDIIGWLLSPVKIVAFSILVLLGIFTASPFMHIHSTSALAFNQAFKTGYGTMDLLGAVFFCSVAYKHIAHKCKIAGITEQKSITKMILVACVIGASLIGLIYTGLFAVAATHAAQLQNIPAEALIGKVAYLVLGPFGVVFVGVCVFFACLATALALAEASADYFYTIVFRNKIPRILCVLMVLGTMYFMAILGFAGIMKIASPILNIVYPVLIALCLINISLKFIPKGFFIRKKIIDIQSEI